MTVASHAYPRTTAPRCRDSGAPTPARDRRDRHAPPSAKRLTSAFPSPGPAPTTMPTADSSHRSSFRSNRLLNSLCIGIPKIAWRRGDRDVLEWYRSVFRNQFTCPRQIGRCRPRKMARSHHSQEEVSGAAKRDPSIFGRRVRCRSLLRRVQRRTRVIVTRVDPEFRVTALVRLTPPIANIRPGCVG